jgi:catechol 2,3-dioxygenase-like lactoylglutathione lyase family enzyme
MTEKTEVSDVSNSLTKISAMSLFVDDLQQAKAFYQDVFGVKLLFEDEVSAAFKFDGLILNLLLESEAPTLVAPGAVAPREAGHRFQLSIWVDDVDSIAAELEEKGVKLTGPVNQEWGMRTVTFQDPAGHSWEIAQSIS